MSPAADRTPSQADATSKELRDAPDSADTQLTAEAHALLSSLDDSVRPTELAARYPRIVNRIARDWRQPKQVDRYLQDLLVDTRGKRQGFPLRIVMEVSTLREHCAAGGPACAAGLWDGNQSLF